MDGGLFYTFEQNSSYCVFIEVHIYTNTTCQADTVANSSLTPNVALLEHPSGTVHSIMNCHKFTGSQK